MPSMKWIGPIVFSKISGNPICGQIFGHQRAKNEARNTKINWGQETHPIRVNARCEMNWANSFFQKVPETLSTDGRTDGQTSGWIQYTPLPPLVERGYNQVIFRSGPTIMPKVKEIQKVVQKLSREQESPASGGIQTGVIRYLHHPRPPPPYSHPGVKTSYNIFTQRWKYRYNIFTPLTISSPPSQSRHYMTDISFVPRYIHYHSLVPWEWLYRATIYPPPLSSSMGWLYRATIFPPPLSSSMGVIISCHDISIPTL